MKKIILCLSMLQFTWCTDPVDTTSQHTAPTYTYQDWQDGNCADVAQIFDTQNPNSTQNRQDFDREFIKYINIKQEIQQKQQQYYSKSLVSPFLSLSYEAAHYENIFQHNMKQILNDHILAKAIDKKIEENNDLSDNCKIAVRYNFDNSLTNAIVTQDEQIIVNNVIEDIEKCANRTKFITYAYIHISLTTNSHSIHHLSSIKTIKTKLSKLISDDTQRQAYLNSDKSGIYIGNGEIFTAAELYALQAQLKDRFMKTLMNNINTMISSIHQISSASSQENDNTSNQNVDSDTVSDIDPREYMDTNRTLSRKMNLPNIYHLRFPDYIAVWEKHQKQFEACETLVHDPKYDFIRPSDLVDPNNDTKVESCHDEDVSMELFVAMEQFFLFNPIEQIPTRQFTDLCEKPDDVSYDICAPDFVMNSWNNEAISLQIPHINSTSPYSKAHILYNTYNYNNHNSKSYTGHFLCIYSALNLDVKNIDTILDLRNIFDQRLEYARQRVKDQEIWHVST